MITLGKQIRTLFDLGAIGATTDRGLLDQFARDGAASEAAFATLVERHGPMVLRVCRQLVTDGHLAEDAFQVTFLLLARRARSVRDPDALAGWLHRVARRVALRARAAIHRRNDRERPQTGDIAVAADSPLERDEMRAIVHEEIDRLGDAQRLPILLCALEGLSHEEAAQRLRWPVGTVKSRLVRGRRRLQGRLARRGLAPALALAAVIADTPALAAPVPLALAVATTRAALQSVVGTTTAAASVAVSVSESVASLLQRELSAMFLAKVTLAVGAVFAACAAGIVIGITLAGSPGQRGQEGTEQQSRKVRPPVEKAPSAPGTQLTRVPKTDRGIPEKLSVIADTEKANLIVTAPERRLSAFGAQVERAIREGVQFLTAQQKPDGSWADVENESKTGVTSLVTLTLLAAGEKPDLPPIQKSLAFLRGFGPNDLRSTYAIALQTMVLAAAEPLRDRMRIVANVEWLERAQMKRGDTQPWPGSWGYSNLKRARPSDNSNTQFALLGLDAARDEGVPIDPSVWELSRLYWEKSQKRDGSWAYTPDTSNSTASMTCAGISSLIITGLRRFQGQEFLQADTIENCGKGGINRNLQAGIDWLANHFQVGQNFGHGQQWKYYYLYGLERAGRLTGMRLFGQRDWYREGALELVHQRDEATGAWQGALNEQQTVLATSFALLFLAKGRAPILINKLRHGPTSDWNNDPDDVRNLVGIVSRDWKNLLTWQIVDSKTATASDLLWAPILFINGHEAPVFAPPERKNLADYVEGGGFIFAEACCGSAEFDKGFKKLMGEMFPAKHDELRPLPDDHPIWQARFQLTPQTHRLWGIRRGDRTVVIYSPTDLSCFWNGSELNPANPAVIKAIRVGQNAIDYATGRKLPPDKLSER
jgi:RNA polymerase sigma factor (sigma-70 family)